MNYWQKIFDYISLPTTNLVYIGIGSGMNDYEEVTAKNNQQYPCFLNKFAGNHLVILIDPSMELNLKLLNYFEELMNPLILQNQTNIPNTENPYIREYVNDKGLFIVINDYFYCSVDPYMEPIEIEQANQHIAILYQIIGIALGKISPSKIIFQNYTGYDTTAFYMSLFDVFDRKQLISNVCFDITQKNGGCFIEFDPDMISLDENINFIQEKYELLVNFPNSRYYLTNLKIRIDLLSYPLVWNYINLKKSVDFERVFENKIKFLAIIYKLDYDLSNNDYNYIIKCYYNIILCVITDIVKSRGIPDDFIDYLINNLENRFEFTNLISILKFE
jgi:hypothetical protein